MQGRGVVIAMVLAASACGGTSPANVEAAHTSASPDTPFVSATLTPAPAVDPSPEVVAAVGADSAVAILRDGTSYGGIKGASHITTGAGNPVLPLSVPAGVRGAAPFALDGGGFAVFGC